MRRWILAGAVIAAVVVVVAAEMLKRGASHPVAPGTTAPGTQLQLPQPQAERKEPVLAVPGQPAGVRAAEVATSIVDGPVVRPKSAGRLEKTKGPTNTAAGKKLDRRDRGVRSSVTEFADWRTVGSASSTLARGTVIPARLLKAIDPNVPGPVAAEVAEDVVKEGVVLVRKGTAIACTSRASNEGRVAVSCDGVGAADRLLPFSGLAVGDGHQVGLRVFDGEVSSGTPFVVYVNASAALR